MLTRIRSGLQRLWASQEGQALGNFALAVAVAASTAAAVALALSLVPFFMEALEQGLP